MTPVDTHRLVLEYLDHYAYLGTLESFVQESGIGKIEASFRGDKAAAADGLGTLKKHERQYSPPLLSSLPDEDWRGAAQLLLTLDRETSAQNGGAAKKKKLEEEDKKDAMSDVPKTQADVSMQPLEGELLRSKSAAEKLKLFPKEAPDFLLERGVVREMLLEGEFAHAELFLRENFPALWGEDPNIKFSICALQFVEFARKGEAGKAVEYAKTQFGPELEGARFVSRDPEGYERLLGVEELFSLLCYEDVEKSPVRHLLSPIQRESVGDYINRKILAIKSKNGITGLEKVLKQLVLTQNFQLEKSNNMGSIFKLKI